MTIDENPPALVDLLTREQQQVLAEKLANVLQEGFGEVTITVRNGHVRFVRILSTYDLTPDAKKDSMRAEDQLTK